MNLWVLWLIIVVILIMIEVSTINLVSIWFVISGIVSLILSFFIDSFMLQFAIFVILGLILLITTKKFLDKWINPRSERTNLDRVIGTIAVVTVPIGKNKVGEVKTLGKYWSAISNKKIDIGEEVIVDAIDGVKLIVRKKEEK
jgi:membrane protein implicated in regulation of membrane protease activity